jgi:hypothetical protein
VLRVGEPLTMTVIFHQDVVIGEADISLQHIGGEVSDVDVSYDAETFTATVTTDQPLAGGRYELTLNDTIVGASGLALDGELTAPLKTTALPSGDGIPGGIAVATFHAIGNRRGSERIQPAD